jgi:hypothetical protein
MFAFFTEGAAIYISNESSIPAGCLRYRATKNALNKAFIRAEMMVEAVQRYSNFEVNVLSRLERISNVTGAWPNPF